MKWIKIAAVAVLSLVATYIFFFHESEYPRPPRIGHVEINLNLTPFHEDLFSINPDSLAGEVDRLQTTYGEFFNTYSSYIVGAGSPQHENFVANMRLFLTYEPNLEVIDTVRNIFQDLDPLKRELTNAFRHYRYYYPENIIPDIFTHISGFNQSIAIDSTWVSISLENYLGSDCIFYEWLGIPVYKRHRMSPENIVPDVMRAMGMSRYAFNDSIDDVLNNMLYHGRILYFVRCMIPRIQDTLLFNYTSSELEWARQNEEMMWATLVERKHLFSTDRMTVTRYVGDSPFTFFFGQESPGRTGHYLGYRIVQSFMRQNPEVTLPELMLMDNGHELFRQSGFTP